MNEKQKEVRKNFLVNRDETGNLIVNMNDGSGKSYMVEFISHRNKNPNNRFGDIDPATKKITGSYGKKYTGSIKEEESVLTEENGFFDTKIIPGGSYMWSVMQKHEEWIAEESAKREVGN